jgi:hypothetical protein
MIFIRKDYVMQSKLLLELRNLNRNLARTSWSNYQKFLQVVLRSYPNFEVEEGLEALRLQDWNRLLNWADGLVNTVYSSPHEHRVYHQFAALIRKYPFPQGTVNTDPEGEAIKRFLASERKCHRINQRFICYRKVRSPHERVLSRARDFVSYVLGDFSLDEVWDECAFGAGASLGIHGNCTNLARKLTSVDWTVSTGAYQLARSALKLDIHVWETLNKRTPTEPFFSLDPELFNYNFGKRAKLVEHNKISFVPKDAKLHRSIAVEPLLNGYLQKGVDVIMRKRLKRIGIDLSDQSRNQIWARKGSEMNGTGGLATIDLSSASDSISIELCRYLLPPEWFYLLNQLRSHSYELKGKVFPYSKFTSMGNGFCFPLETLLFAALCHAAHDEGQPMTKFLVYGDDIIVESHVYESLISLLGICGFSVNKKKTFNTGPFRESCGADWFSGEDVRPIILDYPFDSFESVAKFCNGSKSKDSWNAIFDTAREFLSSLIPRSLYLCRPYKGNVDTAFEVPWDTFLASPFSRFHPSGCSWSWLELVRSPTPDSRVRMHAGYSIALMAGALRGAKSSCPFAERYSSRTKVRRIGYSGATSLFLPYGVG